MTLLQTGENDVGKSIQKTLNTAPMDEQENSPLRTRADLLFVQFVVDRWSLDDHIGMHFLLGW